MEQLCQRRTDGKALEVTARHDGHEQRRSVISSAGETPQAAHALIAIIPLCTTLHLPVRRLGRDDSGHAVIVPFHIRDRGRASASFWLATDTNASIGPDPDDCNVAQRDSPLRGKERIKAIARTE